MEAAIASSSIAGSQFIATHVGHLRTKYKTSPAIWDTGHEAKASYYAYIKYRQEYCQTNRHEFRKKSLTTARRDERKARKMIREYVEAQGCRPESFKDRLLYDQYRANEETQIYHLNEMRMRHQDKDHDRRVMASRQREREMTEEQEKIQREEDREAEDRKSANLNGELKEITRLLRLCAMGGSGGHGLPPDPCYDSGYGSRGSSRQR